MCIPLGLPAQFVVSLTISGNNSIHDTQGVSGTPDKTSGTNLSFPVVKDFAATIIVVDPNQIGTLNMGQLADYIGLIGLAQINLDTDLGPAPSILNVFHASATSPPSELTPWDRALLSALYSTRQRDRMQLSKMQTLAVNYIASTALHQ
jgi:hypothetical protein